jgi:hypothetical protein
VDDGADGCVTVGGLVTISGIVPDSEFDIFAFEASRRSSAAAPCSESTGAPVPWTNVSFTEARDACLRLNTAESGCSYTSPDSNADSCWDLCSAEQWYYTCAYWGALADTPHLYPYADTYNGATCNGDDYGAGNIIATGEATGCLAEWGTTDVMDLSGNVEEWTLDMRTVGSTDLRVIRGGSYKTVANGLTCNFDFFAADETELQMDQLGFRCCRGVDPITGCQNALNKIPNHPFDFNVTGDISQCSTDGWWRANADDPTSNSYFVQEWNGWRWVWVEYQSENEWEVGRASEAGDTENCVWGTDLDNDYSIDDRSHLYSPHFDLSACAGQNIGLSWDMWLENGGDSGDNFRLQVRTSDDDGENWSGWSTATDLSDENLNWTTSFDGTIASPVVDGRLYQLRFTFDDDDDDSGAYVDNVTFEVQ